jgi:hypothetical protein
MNASTPEPAAPGEPAPPRAARPSSLLARLFNVLAAPGEVFAEVRDGPPRAAHWVLPACLLVLVGWLGTWLVFSQPVFRQQQDEIQLRVLQRMVENGKLTREQFELLQQNLGGGGPAKYMLGPAVAVLGLAVVSPFWGAFLIWLIGAKLHGGRFTYGKALEVAGLANMVAVLGSLVRTLLILALGRLQAAPTPALLLPDFDPFNPLHAALATLDLFGVWVCGVRAAGMAALGGPAWGRSFAWLVAIWAGLNGLLVAASWGVSRLLGF